MSSLPSRTDRLNGALYGSFIGDALCLAPHWIYDPEEIQSRWGRVTDYLDPSTNPYHSAKTRGEFTHYGDQAICLMQSINHVDGFSLDTFRAEWKAMWTGYAGYIDGATKSTLRNGRSDSHDLAGASRIAPLVVGLHKEEPRGILQAITEQTALTHAHPEVVDAARFFGTLTLSLIDGSPWEDALKKASEADYMALEPEKALAAVDSVIEKPPAAALDTLGRACSLTDGFPATLYFLQRFRDSLSDALIENANAGGDSASRGLLIGMVLGAEHGVGHLPEHWIQELQAHPLIFQWLEERGLHPEA
ncbi:MAG: ADP-ribosylglycohydrolase family protein [Verrucomicrobiales bacterium]|nr:ADP-ribosylglycohydrolase family protein [Verrucomicrobiales bacterium]